MTRYRNEAAFSKALVAALRRRGVFAQRIESGTTGKGIPDLFLVIPSMGGAWFELKTIHQMFVPSHTYVIPWRPGQQSWLWEVSKRGVPCATLISFDNAFVMLNHKRIYEGNVFNPAETAYARYASLSEIISEAVIR